MYALRIAPIQGLVTQSIHLSHPSSNYKANCVRLVVTTRMGEMYALRDQALDWSNPKGIHDMRVASRRLRSALHDFIPYLRKRRLTASLRGIKAIADALGEVRDQDVAIIAL